MKSNQKNLTILLIVLLALTIGYIILDKYNEKKQEEQLNIFQQGVQAGYEQAVVQLINELVSCQPIPLFANNQTINVIAVECLQQAPQEQLV